jgi:hypothetical protein
MEGDPIGGDEHAPIPDDIREQLERDLGRLRNLKGSAGSGDVDPADDAGFEVRDPAVQLPTHAELGQSLFGQPPLDGDTGGGGGNFNPGADSQGAGVITPDEEQDLGIRSGPEDDPLAGGGQPLEPAADTSEDDEADAVVSLVPSEIEGPVDDGPELPDFDELP